MQEVKYENDPLYLKTVPVKLTKSCTSARNTILVFFDRSGPSNIKIHCNQANFKFYILKKSVWIWSKICWCTHTHLHRHSQWHATGTGKMTLGQEEWAKQ